MVWGHYLFPAGFVAVTVAELHGKRSVVSARGNDIDRLMFPPGDFARLQWTLERATQITAVSNELVKKIDVILGRKSHAKVLGNVVDVNVFRAAVPSPKTDETGETAFWETGKPVLGFCGELRQKKGLPVLLQTFEQLNRRMGAKLLIIGAVRTRENNELADFLADFPHLTDHVMVTGHLDKPEEVATFINRCDVMLCPSLWDGVPDSILESMACEKIVVASDAGGISDIISMDETGFLVSKHSLANFPMAVEEVLNLGEADQKRIQNNAREFCLDLWKSKRHLNILQELIGTKN